MPGNSQSDQERLAGPTRTAVVTMELERGVVGDLASLPDLRDVAAEYGTLEACGDLVKAARSSSIAVVHCVAKWRADLAGTTLNTPLTRALARNPGQILEGTQAVDLIPELGDTSDDLRSERYHGLTPFTGTDLDPLLRSLGITKVVVCGVSLNVGIPGLVLGAVDRGYEVTVATNAVVGVPFEYGGQVIKHTLAALARLEAVSEIASDW